MRLLSVSVALTFLSVGSDAASAGFDVTFWHLSTATSDLGDSSPADSEDVFAITNPLTQLVQTQIGPSFTSAYYDHSWLPDLAVGTFNTDITHGIASPDIINVTRTQIFFLADEPIRVTINGSLTYSHTPGDDTGIRFGASVRDTTTNDDLSSQTEQGGNLYLLPSAGTLNIAGEAILDAGVIYRLQFVIDSSNTGDLPPTGTLDASGYLNFAITPVPEPATAMLLLAAAPILLRRRRGAT